MKLFKAALLAAALAMPFVAPIAAQAETPPNVLVVAQNIDDIVAIAIIVLSNAVMRNLTWPGVAAGLLALAAVSIGGIYPWAVQTFEVKPTLRDKEAPYIEASIRATRYAFGLEDTKITPYPGTGSTPPEEMLEDETLRASIRLLDPEILTREPAAILALLAVVVVGKSLAALTIVALLRRPVSTGLTVAVGLAQVGEFSFIVATTGTDLGLLPERGFQLVVATALLSISINPLLFGMIEPVTRIVRRRPRLARILDPEREPA